MDCANESHFAVLLDQVPTKDCANDRIAVCGFVRSSAHDLIPHANMCRCGFFLGYTIVGEMDNNDYRILSR